MSKTRHKAESSEGVGVTHTLKVTVPPNWEVIPLETVLEDIVGGGTPSRDNPSYWNGSIPWLTVKDMRTRRPEDSIDHISKDAVRNSATNIIPADTVIIATRIGLGKVIRVPYDAAINQDLKALITKPTVDKSYLEYWIYSIANYLESIGSGTTVKGIRLEHVRSLPFPLAPLDQQKRIVAEIEKQFSRLDEAVANLKRVKANLKRYKAAVLKAAVEGRLVETEAELARKKTPSPLAGEGGGEGASYETGTQLLQRILETRRSQWKGKGKYKEPAAPDTTDLPELPEGWIVASLEQLTSSERVICYGILMPKENVPGGVLYVKVRDMKGDKVDMRSLQRTSPEIAAKYARASLKTGDLLLAIRGTYGRIAEVPTELDGGNITQDTARLAVSPLMDSNYVAWFLRSQDAQNYFKRVARGVAVKGVNIADVRVCPILLPSLPEQRRIVFEVDRRLSLVHEVEGEVDVNLKRAHALRQSILSCAFNGKLLTDIDGPSGSAHMEEKANAINIS